MWLSLLQIYQNIIYDLKITWYQLCRRHDESALERHETRLNQMQDGACVTNPIANHK